MDNLDFSEEEIQEQLAILGYRNIPKHRLHEFKQDLDELIRGVEWKTLASPTQTDATKTHPASTQPSPPAYTKEKVSQSYFQGSNEGFFLHPSKTFHESHLRTTSQNRRCEQQQGNCDSYARHSVAPKLQLPSGAPSRLRVEQDPEDALHPSFTDSYTSPPDSQGRRLIKRKVLRKQEGQSLVCDESFYSEDSALCLHSSLCTHLNTVKESNMYKMYNAQWDEGSEDDKNSLNSSFWSDEEKEEEEEEEEVEIERVVSEEESKVVAKMAEATLEKENGSSDEEGGEIKRVVKEEESKPVDEEVESSQEEKPDMMNQENFTRESSEDRSDEEVEEEEVVDDEEEGSDDEEEEEEEEDEGEATEQEVNEDESKLAEEEESFQEDSEEEKPEVKNQENFTGESSEDGRDEEEEEEEGEDDEEEEEVEIERVVNKEESKPVDEASQEASEKKKTDMKNQENFTQESSEDGSDEEVEEEEEGADDEEDGSDEEEGTEDEEETKQEEDEEESKLVAETEDFLLEASEEETPEVKNQENFTTESCEDASDEEEEEEEMERVANKDVSKPVAETEDFLQEASEEETPEVKNQENFTTESSKCGGDDDEKEEEEEGNVTSSCSSPAQSLMTSGYGTYRPEEQEGGDYRDDHTITEFDQDSRGDVSEMRDYEEDSRSLSSFGGFEIESTRERGYDETRPESALESEDKNEPGADRAAWSSRGRRHEELDVTNDKSQENVEKIEDLDTDSENTDVTNERSEGRQHVAVNKESDEKNPEEGTGNEKLDEEEWDVKVETEAEDQDPDESLSNKDIKFIDSKVDFSWMAYDDMEWEGNLRQKKNAASCLEDGLAELHVSSSTHRDFETENEDVSGHSSDEDRISLSAFESYISGMTDSQSDRDLRPKPKSFIRPVMNQQNVKKTDPVAKYFQYKQFWETFKLPGEKDRRALRWEIRDRLAYEPPPKPRRVLVPNTYIVPTEKKRSALRWEIRSDLANGLLPHKFND